MLSKKLDRVQVESWLEALRDEKAKLEETLDPLLNERSRLEEQENIVLALIASLKSSRDTPGDAGKADSTSSRNVSTPVATGSTVKEQVEARVIEILEDAGAPLHINEIHSRYRERGWKVPGAGEPVNITSHIRVSHRIRSPKRGVYGLVEQVGDIPRKKSSKRRRNG
jgi:hypothetical protein